MHSKKKRGSSSVGRASAFQAECRRFEPGLPLKSKAEIASSQEGAIFAVLIGLVINREVRSGSLTAQPAIADVAQG